MLLYSSNREFIGADAYDLNFLGFSTLAELMDEAADFVDLFVKIPGYIYNFDHVHWIDYVMCSEDVKEFKVIIHVKNKSYFANLDIKTSFFINSPSQSGYVINLLNLKPLSLSQSQNILSEIEKMPKPKSIIKTAKHTADNELKQIEQQPKASNQNLEEIAPKSNKEELRDYFIDSYQEVDNYMYNPKIASKELGIRVDLIEEFVQDFVIQAMSFKDELYLALGDKEINSIKIYSHKLKGVAANLKIESALKILITINSLNDFSEIKSNLDMFYLIINKLSKKGTSMDANNKNSTDNDDLVLSIKQREPLEINDSDVPDYIELPELEDDEFLKSKVEFQETDLNIQELSFLGDSKNQNDISEVGILYDKEIAAEELGVDMARFDDMFKRYLNESKELCKKIAIYVKEHSFEDSKDAALELKRVNEGMKIHSFNDDLQTIIRASNFDEIENSNKNIISMLELLQKQNT